MDRDRFDTLTRLFATVGSRRAALSALAGAGLLGGGAIVSAKPGKKGKKKKKHNRRRPCFGDGACAFPSDGLDFENCNLALSSIESCDGCNFRRADLGGVDFEEGSFQGVSFRNANLSGADLSFTDVSGASFRDACLSGANFFDANTDGADFRGAIFCGTTLRNGFVDDSGCDNDSRCCPPVACLKDGDCPEGTPTCCNGACVNTSTNPLNCGSCLSACFTDEECIEGECIGTCGEPCIKDKDCPGDQICCDGTCCGGDLSCRQHIPGPGDVCVDVGIGGCSEPCVKDAECPPNWACIDDGQCEFTHCHPLCSAVISVSDESAGRGRRGH